MRILTAVIAGILLGWAWFGRYLLLSLTCAEARMSEAGLQQSVFA
jgi:hypothetical protein